MKRSILVITFIVMAFFSTNAFSQSQIEIDQRAVEKSRVESGNNVAEMPFDPSIFKTMRQSFLEMTHQNEEQITSASSEIVFSENSDDFNMLKGTTWSIKYIIGTTIFEDTISFFNNTATTDTFVLGLAYTNQYRQQIGTMAYVLSGGEIFTSIGDVSQPFYFASVKDSMTGVTRQYVFNLISASFLSGYYHASIFSPLSSYPLTGVKTSFGLNDTDDDGDGYTENQDDCNDNNATIHPKAIEICGDGIDQDCDGKDKDCLPSSEVLPPSNLLAKAKAQIQIVLCWKDNSNDETGFRIEKKIGNCDATNAWEQLAILDANSVRHTVTGLTPGTTYAFRVCTLDAIGKSDFSNCVSEKTGGTGTPPSPTGIKAESVLSSKISLSWKDCSITETGFKIYRKDGSDAWELFSTTGPNVTSFNDYRAYNNSTSNSYRYYVCSYNASGESPPTYPVIVPNQPLDTSTILLKGVGKTKVTWTDNSDENGFEIWRKSGSCTSTSEWSLAGKVAGNRVFWIDSASSPDKTYSYKVRAYKRTGNMLAAYGFSLFSSSCELDTDEVDGNEDDANQESLVLAGDISFVDHEVLSETKTRTVTDYSHSVQECTYTYDRYGNQTPHCTTTYDTKTEYYKVDVDVYKYTINTENTGNHPLSYKWSVSGNAKIKEREDTSEVSLSYDENDKFFLSVVVFDSNGNNACRTYSSSSAVTSACSATSLGMTFVYIEPGTFTMGSPSSELGRTSDETQHQVTLTQGYYIQTTEVTQGQWEAVMGTNPSSFDSCGDNCPVEEVSWDDAQSFINELNRLEGSNGYRLPTEAQWEYAARAGTTTAFANGEITETIGDYDTHLNVMGWYCYNSDDTTHQVAQKQANAWGLYDMHGNVWEWCADRYGSLSSGSVTDPEGSTYGPYRVLRGGSWINYPRLCRSALRGRNTPGGRYYNRGFRVVLLPGQ